MYACFAIFTINIFSMVFNSFILVCCFSLIKAVQAHCPFFSQVFKYFFALNNFFYVVIQLVGDNKDFLKPPMGKKTNEIDTTRTKAVEKNWRGLYLAIICHRNLIQISTTVSLSRQLTENTSTFILTDKTQKTMWNVCFWVKQISNRKIFDYQFQSELAFLVHNKHRQSVNRLWVICRHVVWG